MPPKAKAKAGAAKAKASPRAAGSGAAAAKELAKGGSTETAGCSDAATPAPAAEDSSQTGQPVVAEELGLESRALARHCFRAKFELAPGNGKEETPTKFVLFVPRLLGHQDGRHCYSDHQISISGHSLRGKPIEIFERPHFVIANVPASALPSLVVEHTFISHSVMLAPQSSAKVLTQPPSLTAQERMVAISDDTDRLDKMRVILHDLGLQRQEDERDITYASRLRLALASSDFKFDAQATGESLHLLPTLIFELKKGDCTAFNAGFVYALRAFGIPAYITLGMKYGKDIEEICGSFLASHAQCEFFAEGIGWIPADATPGAAASFLHEGGSKASFLGWHNATMTFAEFQASEDVMRSSSDVHGSLAKLQKICPKKGLTDTSADVGDKIKGLEESFALALGLDADAARRRVASTLQFCRDALGSSARVTLEMFLAGFVACEIGKCPIYLGFGKNVCSTAMAGAKLFEGGPYDGDGPLDLEDMKECIMLLRGHDKVMEAVNDGALSRQGQFHAAGGRGCTVSVDYEFTEEPVA
eukprot:TRINITY_DN110708_c0_g1_i1.p1 TRINITY_DN110708_c0_g1~~TRINITY_DN110708_c0_g1_i1.p1  ORF type:complete len:532 (+),score=114.04 TRINITY_DN110708_c0_g1_i1:94-1689(+)